MNELIKEAIIFIFGSDFVSTLLMVGITFVVCVVTVLAILKKWGRYA